MDKCCIRGEWNWPISHLNDSETQERGLEGVKIQKISWGSMPPYPPRSFGACIGNQSVFILDPRLPSLRSERLEVISRPVQRCCFIAFYFSFRFSFFSKISASGRAKRAFEKERGARERKKDLSGAGLSYPLFKQLRLVATCSQYESPITKRSQRSGYILAWFVVFC